MVKRHFWLERVEKLWRQRSVLWLAIECKWSTREFDPRNFLAFTHQYPRSECVVVTSDAAPGFGRKYGQLAVKFIGLPQLVGSIGTR